MMAVHSDILFTYGLQDVYMERKQIKFVGVHAGGRLADGGAFRSRGEATDLRLRRLALVFYFATDIYAHVDELQQVLALTG